MSPSRRKIHYPAQLPPTPCTRDMRERIVRVADERAISIAEVQREAFALFLSSIDNINNTKSSEANINRPDP